MGLMNAGKGMFDKARDTSVNAYNNMAMTEAEVMKYLTESEEAVAIISQYIPHKMKTLVLTNDRVLIFTKELLKRSFEDYYFKDLKDAHFSNDLVKQGTITLTTDADGKKKVIKVSYLPTDDSREFYKKLQKIEKDWAGKKREIELEDKRAASGAASIVLGTAPAQPVVPQAASVEEKLMKLKSLKERGLIDDEAYKVKSAQLLDEL